MFSGLIKTVGIEIEGFVDPIDGYTRDLPSLLGEGIPFGKFGRITTDAGCDQIEWILNPCRSIAAIREEFKKAASLCPIPLHEIHFVPRRPAHFPNNWWVPRPRTEALLQALRKEVGHGAAAPVHDAINIAATHYHLGGFDPLSHDGVTVLNCLNAGALVITRVMMEHYSVPNPRRLQVWKGFALPKRLPHPFWFRDVKHLEAYFRSIPRLITQVDTEAGKNASTPGSWEVDCQNASRLGDKASEGTCWWLVRPRTAFGTVEFRPLPSLPTFEAVAMASGLVVNWAEECVDHVGDRAFDSFDEAMKFGLPPFCGALMPRSEEEWWQQFSQL